MPTPTPTPTGSNYRFFEETQHSIGNAMKAYFEANGGIAEFGFPLTEELSGGQEPFDALPELNGYTVQLFERELLHYKDGEGVGRGRAGALALAIQSGGAASMYAE